MADRQEMLNAIHSFEQFVARSPESNINRSLWNWTITYLAEVERTGDFVAEKQVQVDQKTLDTWASEAD